MGLSRPDIGKHHAFATVNSGYEHILTGGIAMATIVSTVAYLGLEARSVEVQIQLIPGLPAFNLVGLADKAVGESRERVRGAIAAMGLSLPPKRIAVNLSPADLPKEGSHFDLPIALALLGAMGIVDVETLSEYVVVGELGLDARIAPSPGVLLAALHASEQGKGLILPCRARPRSRMGGIDRGRRGAGSAGAYQSLQGARASCRAPAGRDRGRCHRSRSFPGQGTGDRQTRARNRRSAHTTCFSADRRDRASR